MIIYKCDKCLKEFEFDSLSQIFLEEDKVADLCTSCTESFKTWLSEKEITAIPDPMSEPMSYDPIAPSSERPSDLSDPTPLQVEEAIQSTTDQPPFINEVSDVPEEGTTDAQMPSMPE